MGKANLSDALCERGRNSLSNYALERLNILESYKYGMDVCKIENSANYSSHH